MLPSWRFRLRVLTVAVCALLTGAGLPALTLAAPPTNDDFAQRIVLPIGGIDARSNVDATIEAGERLTANDPQGHGCTAAGVAAAGGSQMAGTVWWGFTGNGKPITVTTDGIVDTLIAIHEVDGGAIVGCNDDVGKRDWDLRTSSEVVVNSVNGRRYAVQAGGCVSGCDLYTSGSIGIRISQPPANDDRATAQLVTPGVAATTATYGATVEAGEHVDCGTARYGRTVWFRFRAPAVGTATFAASGFDTVMAIYREGSSTPLACNDDADTAQQGPSRVPAIRPAGTPIAIEPGDYLVQVGGFYDPPLTPIAARGGPLTLEVGYTEDVDRDDDGYARDVDCADLDATIHPGAVEVPNNDVDENCDGVVAYDRDGDGYLAPVDCRDDLATVYPGAIDVAGNGVDEDCNGVDAVVLADRDRDRDGVLDPPFGDDCDPGNAAIRPGAVDAPENGIDEDCRGGDAALPVIGVRFRIVWEVDTRRAGFTRAERLEVKSVPAGTKIELRCKGGGCSFSKRTQTVKRKTSLVALTKGLKGGISLRNKASFEIRVTRPGHAGEIREFRMRTGKAPTRADYCVRGRGRVKGAC